MGFHIYIRGLTWDPIWRLTKRVLLKDLGFLSGLTLWRLMQDFCHRASGSSLYKGFSKMRDIRGSISCCMQIIYRDIRLLHLGPCGSREAGAPEKLSYEILMHMAYGFSCKIGETFRTCSHLFGAHNLADALEVLERSGALSTALGVYQGARARAALHQGAIHLYSKV